MSYYAGYACKSIDFLILPVKFINQPISAREIVK